MSIKYIVSTVKNNDQLIGARVIDTETLTAINLPIDRIKSLSEHIKNVELRDGELVWTHGAMSRYPSVRFESGEVENRDSVVVLGVDSNKVYTIANYNGDVTTISEEGLISYANKFSLANCKLVTKGETSYIASISGELDVIESKPRLKYDTLTNKITVTVPSTGVTKLVIPSQIGVYTIRRPEEIEIVPSICKYKIKHLVLPNTVYTLKLALLKALPNLEKLECMGTISIVEHKAFASCKNLKYVSAVNIDFNSGDVFKGAQSLKRVELKVQPESIGYEAFSGCKNLEIGNLLGEGLTYVGNEAFSGCDNITEITLPSTLNTIDSSAFTDCRNLKTVNIKNYALDIRSIKINKNQPSIKLFDGCGEVNVNIPYYFPESVLRYISVQAKIVRDNPPDTLEKDELKKMKASVLGGSFGTIKKAKSNQDMKSALMVVSGEVFKKGVCECAMTYFHGTHRRISNTIADKGVFFDVTLYIQRSNAISNYGKFIASRVGQNYMVIVNSSSLIVVPVGPHLYLEAIDEGKDMIGYNLALLLPTTMFKVKASEIANIREEGNSLVITNKDGEVRKIQGLGGI